MIVIDVNVLVALFRAESPDHERARQWWDTSSAEGLTTTAPDQVWTGFVRIVTHPRIFSVPATLEQAFGFMDALLAQPTYLPLGPLPTVLAEFRRLSVDSGVRGNLVTDAYIAAVARCLGARVVTFDRDFRRFDDLRLLELG